MPYLILPYLELLTGEKNMVAYQILQIRGVLMLHYPTWLLQSTPSECLQAPKSSFLYLFSSFEMLK